MICNPRRESIRKQSIAAKETKRLLVNGMNSVFYSLFDYVRFFDEVVFQPYALHVSWVSPFHERSFVRQSGIHL